MQRSCWGAHRWDEQGQHWKGPVYGKVASMILPQTPEEELVITYRERMGMGNLYEQRNEVQAWSRSQGVGRDFHRPSRLCS